MPAVEIDFNAGQSLLSNPLVLVGLGILFLIFLLIVAAFIIRNNILKKGKISKAFQKKILQITVPKQSADDKQSGPPALQQIQEKIGVMETLFTTIAGLKAEKGFKAWLFGHQDIFSLELVADKEGMVNFYMAVPVHYQQYLEEQIHAQFSFAFIEEIPDYNLFTPKSIVGGKMLSFKRSYYFPIKTYKNSDSDPLNGLVNALSKIDKEDGAVIQIVIKSAAPNWRSLAVKIASKMQQGMKMETAVNEVKSGGVSKALGTVGKVLQTKAPEQKTPEQYRLSPAEEEAVKMLEAKTSKAGVDANIRIVVSSESQIKVEQHLNNLVNAFGQYQTYKLGNGFKITERPLNRLIQDFIYRNYDEAKRLVLSTEELASLYHFPIPQVNETPNIRWLQSKKAPAPDNMPSAGVLLGYNEYRGRKTEIRIKDEDRRRHMYVIGMTGTGKSYLLVSACVQDIARGAGVCYIDPHGDAIGHILERIPKSRAEDVVILDPSDIQRPMGLNLLEFKTEEDKTFAINELMAIFDKLYDLKATGGPMFEQYFKNAAALIMADPESGSTLLEISRVLSDDDFRKYKLARCQNQLVKDFWEKEALKAGGEAALQNMVPYITSKMSPFITNDFVRPIISQQKSTIDFADIMNNKKILLVKLSKGKIGQINSDLLGMLVIGKILMAALGRGDMPEEERKDFYLYVDEFQNYLTDSMEIILSEARKYRLCLNIAHQYVGQLIKGGDTKFKDAIFGNVGTKVSFRIGVDDAEALTKEFAPVFNEYDFLNVPKYNAYVKLLIDNANPPGFNMSTIDFSDIPGVPAPNPKLADAMRELSRLKYGKDPNMIDLEVKERYSKTFKS